MPKTVLSWLSEPILKIVQKKRDAKKKKRGDGKECQEERDTRDNEEEKGREKAGRGARKKILDRRALRPNQEAQGFKLLYLTVIMLYYAVLVCLLPISPDPLKILQSGRSLILGLDKCFGRMRVFLELLKGPLYHCLQSNHFINSLLFLLEINHYPIFSLVIIDIL